MENEIPDEYEDGEYENVRKRVYHYLLRIQLFNVWKDQLSWEDVRQILREGRNMKCTAIALKVRQE